MRKRLCRTGGKQVESPGLLMLTRNERQFLWRRCPWVDCSEIPHTAFLGLIAPTKQREPAPGTIARDGFGRGNRTRSAGSLANEAGADDITLTTNRGVRVGHRAWGDLTDACILGFNRSGRLRGGFAFLHWSGVVVVSTSASAIGNSAAWLGTAARLDVASTPVATEAAHQAIEDARLAAGARIAAGVFDAAVGLCDTAAWLFAAAMATITAHQAVEDGTLTATGARAAGVFDTAAWLFAAAITLVAIENTVEQATSAAGANRIAASLFNTAAGLFAAASPIGQTAEQAIEQPRTARRTGTTGGLTAVVDYGTRWLAAAPTEQTSAEARVRQGDAHHERSEQVPFHQSTSPIHARPPVPGCWLISRRGGLGELKVRFFVPTAVPPVFGMGGVAVSLEGHEPRQPGVN